MELRKYQQDVLNKLGDFLDILTEQHKEQEEYAEFLKSKNKEPQNQNIPKESWEKISQDIYSNREDGIGNPIPNVCLKVPTGGGKTLLATHAVKMINQRYFGRNTGLILWIVPSDAIYSQTLKAFKDIDHPYRRILDHAAPRKRAKILERKSVFSPHNVYQDLSVMLLMQQASDRENKETLRMFRDSGAYMDFFPSSNDYQKHAELLEKYPNLDTQQLVGDIKSIKYSLGNVFKILRPIIVLDEGHTAKSLQRRERFNDFNPRFILELSATPPPASNVIVDIPGQALKDEEMIKLPIKLTNSSDVDWQETLSASCEKLKDLEKQAYKHRSNGGKYIRPMLLVRVENTGKDQQGKGSIHSEDVRKHLVEKLGFQPHEVKAKTSEVDEIAKEDLLSEGCGVKVVMTKDALKEGWDCPFAYVLCFLDKTRSVISLTQMIGRVLRQPYAELTDTADLNMSHIFCLDEDVGKLVNNIKKSFDNHGLGDMIDRSITSTDDEIQEEIINRREEFKDLDILMPKVFYTKDGKKRVLDYERDILSQINWEKLKCSQEGVLLYKRNDRKTETWIDIDNDVPPDQVTKAEVEGEISGDFFAQNLADLIPNPWQAMRIAQEILTAINKQGSKQNVYANRMDLVNQMRQEISDQKEQNSQAVFLKKIQKGEIMFTLDAKDSQWAIPKNMTNKYVDHPHYLTKKTGEQPSLGLFDKYPSKDFNEFETAVAGYLDDQEAIKWWHRIAAKKEYGFQGWRKHVVYPDFVLFVNKEEEYSVILETKGKHLEGNEDTLYKKKLLEVLEKNYLDVGDVKLKDVGSKILLRIIYQDKDKKNDTSWQKDVNSIINQTT